MAARQATTVSDLVERWSGQASEKERMARAGDATEIEKRLLRAHARVYRACADDLRRALEADGFARGRG
jgi:hypothetical protein